MKMKLNGKLVAGVTSVAIALSLAACGGTDTPSDDMASEGTKGETTEAADKELPIKGSSVALTGAGASFPAPLYQNWFVQMNKAIPQIQVNYQSVGSGAGVEQFTAKTVDFGASDVAMKDEEIAAVDDNVLLLPMTAGSIVMAYNLEGIDELNLSREAYVEIFMGKITKWNDPKIAEANPDVELPDQDITVVHRSDGSGTTGVFTKHLSAISPEWESSIGEGKTVEWPTTGNFVGGKGNEGVTAQITQTPGAIGYVEYGYANQNDLPVASLENQSGNFIAPSAESAAETLSAVELPENLRAFITDPEGDESYPIVTYTWLLVYKTYEDPDKAVAMEAAIEYGLTEGQKQSEELGYIPLPENVVEKVAAVADEISPDYTIKVK
ncbi:MAG: phosphate ABC transporter substrate-binding protein PstS [Jaaginema sp. PMC 1079.18]|nr:phosphate ABC transporter substrate-binding protein PstS [Jaaginema sp. PMC 1080.18]MEC4851666.1 phosphate ABC transporter substrate-binding protein PstS [Jaaginema sp. PMC 1079.18]MEC4867336.1 phosphate ABC transporter substrate-binding protein PstS [Jaaginema sp. PMC 1078.18]